MPNNKYLAVIGMGYVGLPLAVEFGKKRKTIGYDLNQTRINELLQHIDKTEEVDSLNLKKAEHLIFTDNINDLKDADNFILTVPTPVDINNQPDMSYVISATEQVSKFIKKGSYIIYESTVYPGATEEVCVPILSNISGLEFNKDFFVGYSPERINPGDKSKRITDIVKVTSGSNEKAAVFIDNLYKEIISAGTYRAPSIKVAEAAKVIENTQRDLNIALVNELSIIFDRLNIDTNEVLDAASTKWNFVKYKPGLVGGHCIGVDPYYLTYKALDLGYEPKIILSGRKLNNSMSQYVSNKLIDLMTAKNIDVASSSILVLGITFKENCPDIRNSKVLDLIEHLKCVAKNVDVYDPWVKKNQISNTSIIDKLEQKKKYDAILLAVPHDIFLSSGLSSIKESLKPNSVFFDLKGVFPKELSDARL